MQFKRNYTSNVESGQGKQNSLIQPLLSIAKASTPVRTRIVKAGSQMNSTPINGQKLPQTLKSPSMSNKENTGNNTYAEGKKPNISLQPNHLSPVLGMNRKLMEASNHEIRSYTPTGFKRQQSLANMKYSDIQDYQNDYQILGARTSTAFGQTLQQRTSGTFKTLLESRSKTPTRLNSPGGFGDLQNSKMRDSGYMRSSCSSQSLLQGVKKLRDSKCSKLSQSRSSEHLFPGVQRVEDNEIFCMNTHDKNVKAKYKVAKSNQDDEELLVYCSKCAIGLVKQGFRVEDLTPQDKNNFNHRRRHENSRETDHMGEYFLYADNIRKKLRAKCHQLKIQKQKQCHLYDGELEQIDSYYNAIITMIEEQRIKDREVFISKRAEVTTTIEQFESELNQNINMIDKMTKNGINPYELSQLQSLEAAVDNTFLEKGKKIKIFDNIQKKLEYFIQQLEVTLKLMISETYPSVKASRNLPSHPLTPQPESTQPYENRVPADCPLRFSFEKLLKLKQINKINKYQGQMKTLEEEDEENRDDDENYGEKRAFRALFPDNQMQQSENTVHSPTFKQF